jgi:hypothetical protein
VKVGSVREVRQRDPGLVLDIRDVLDAFKAAVEAGELTGFKDSAMRAHSGQAPPVSKSPAVSSPSKQIILVAEGVSDIAGGMATTLLHS